MQSQLKKVESLKNELSQLSPLKSEDQKRLDKKFRLEFSYNSNHLEGNTLTYGETELLILYDDTKGNHTLREFEEMKSHDIAFLKINDWAKEDRELTETDIKELNKIILVRDFWKEAITEDNQPTRRKISVGNYKQYPNSVRLENGEMFDYASVTDTPILMKELMDWYKTDGKNFHPVVLAALFHYKFVTIHPFDDGNGRIARLLLNYILLKNNFPPVVIKSNDKKNYLSALHKADLGDLEAFSEYILEQTIWSLELSIKAAKGENIDEPNDWEKKLAQMKMEVFKDKNKQIEQTFNSKNAENIIKTAILPLLKILDEKLKKLEVLFINSNYYSINLLYEKSAMSLSEALNRYRNEEYIRNKKIILWGKYSHLIKINPKLLIETKRIIFDFNDKNYVLLIGNETFVKFYNEVFNDIDIEIIVNLIATDLIKKIEEAQNT